MDLQHTVQADPGLTGCRIALGTLNTEIHVAQANQPDFDLLWEGQLEPGNYALEGSCSSSRAARSLGGGEWVFENGDATLTGSVSLEFHDGMIVGTEQVSLGELKAMFR